MREVKCALEAVLRLWADRSYLALDIVALASLVFDKNTLDQLIASGSTCNPFIFDLKKNNLSQMMRE